MPPNVKKTSFRHLPTRTPTYWSKDSFSTLKKKIPWIKRRMPLTHKSEPLAGEASPVSRSEKVHQKGLKKNRIKPIQEIGHRILMDKTANADTPVSVD